MIRYQFTLILCTIVTISIAQINYEPQLLILSPNDIKYEKGFTNEIAKLNEEISADRKKLQESGNADSIDQSKPENVRTMLKDEVDFCKNLDFFKQTSYNSEQFLAYSFYENFPNLLIRLKDAKSKGTVQELRNYSETEKLQYVLNFSSIELYRKNKISYAKVTVQLYDHVSNSLVLNKQYTGDWNNPGFEFACKDQSVTCTINNALSQALEEVINIIYYNSPTVKAETALQQKRFDVLMSDYYSKPYDRTFLTNIFTPADSNIDVKIMYQNLFDTGKNKFIAFFIKQAPMQDLKGLRTNGQDKNVNIQTHYNIKEKGYLDDMPQTYAYIVKGIKFNGKWYYEKSEVTYFDAKTMEEGKQRYFNNLQMWNFFKDNTTDFNTEFWETSQFEKVKDLRKDPDWDKYGTTIWKSQEEDDRNYIGQYRLIVRQLEKDKEAKK